MQAEDVTVPDATTGVDADADADADVRKPARGVEDEVLEPVRVVEAALFSAGKPLALDEIAENTGLGKRAVKSALKKLVNEYAEHETALEIGPAGDKWAMQVKARYARATERLAPMEIPERVLRTLALIAYHQPLLQSDLIAMVGAKGYDHVRELHERGLVRKRVHDRSFMLLTTDRFPEYFGIPATDRDGIKKVLAEKLGIRVGQKPEASREAEAAVAAEKPEATEGASDAAAAPTEDAEATPAPAGEADAAPPDAERAEAASPPGEDAGAAPSEPADAAPPEDATPAAEDTPEAGADAEAPDEDAPEEDADAA